MVEDSGNQQMSSSSNLDDMSELQEMWQDTPPVDMQQLAKHERFVWWRMRVNFALEVLVAVAGLVVIGTSLTFSSVPGVVFGFVAWLYCMGALWAAFRIRRGAWDDAGESALSLVELQIKRAQSSILYVRLNSYFGYIGLGIIALAFWVLEDKHNGLPYSEFGHVYWIFGVMAVFLVVFPFALRPYVRRKEAEVARLEGLAKQLGEG
jgi:hypothetical protein